MSVGFLFLRLTTEYPRGLEQLLDFCFAMSSYPYSAVGFTPEMDSQKTMGRDNPSLAAVVLAVTPGSAGTLSETKDRPQEQPASQP